MTVIKKIWAWLKSYWYIPLLVVVLIVSIVLLIAGNNSGVKRVIDLFNKSKEKYEKEIDIIETNNQLKEKEKKQSKENYDRALMEIEKKIELKKEELSSVQKKKVKELVKKHGNDYDAMVQEMADEYGFKVI